jgi:putative tryptophan/tyrosine transport system substrate-binding protein
MRRRDFVTLLGSAAATRPLATRAQQPAMPVIGFLSANIQSVLDKLVAAFRKGLAESGYVEGRNVAVEYRWAEGKYDRLPALARELVRFPVAVIAVPDTTPGALAAKAATTSIPIVFGTGGDPVKLGLVSSLNRPGGNLTGVTRLSAELTAKRLELLHELVPAAAVLGVVINPENPSAQPQTRQAQDGANRLGVRLIIETASSESDLDRAFTTFAQRQVAALLVGNDVFFTSQREKLATLAAHHAIPAMYSYPEYVIAGGLISYSASNLDSVREVGAYTARILKGERPADLPVLQSAKFQLVIDLKTAKALGMEIPAKLLALADEVIE